MKKIIMAVLTIVFAVGMVGCDDAGENVASASAEPTQSVIETRFLDMMHRDIPSTVIVSDEDLIDVARGVCGDLEPYAPVDEMSLGSYTLGFIDGVEEYLSPEEAATFIGYSIWAFCPDVIEGNTV